MAIGAPIEGFRSLGGGVVVADILIAVGSTKPVPSTNNRKKRRYKDNQVVLYTMSMSKTKVLHRRTLLTVFVLAVASTSKPVLEKVRCGAPNNVECGTI